jgi:F0F1-type ATP synthase assembly protein I
MIPDSSDRKELGRYLAFSQVGLEMVAPIALGLALDHYLGWAPWGVVAGAVLGLCGGLAHLVYLANQTDATKSSKPDQESR